MTARALTDADVEAIEEALARRGVRQDGGGEMGYAENVMLLREAESETEIVIERMDVDGDALELRVTLGYGSPASARVGYIRLCEQHVDALAEWIGNLREIRRAKESAPQGDE